MVTEWSPYGLRHVLVGDQNAIINGSLKDRVRKNIFTLTRFEFGGGLKTLTYTVGQTVDEQPSKALCTTMSSTLKADLFKATASITPGFSIFGLHG